VWNTRIDRWQDAASSLRRALSLDDCCRMMGLFENALALLRAAVHVAKRRLTDVV
jgi:hypothetical protein